VGRLDSRLGENDGGPRECSDSGCDVPTSVGMNQRLEWLAPICMKNFRGHHPGVEVDSVLLEWAFDGLHFLERVVFG